jgi:phytoene desaturase
VLEGIFREVGAEFDVRPAGPPRYLVNGKVCEVPATGGLRTLISAASQDSTEVERVVGAVSTALKQMEPPRELSLRDWLMHYTANESILGIFQAMVSATMAVNTDELPAREYFLFLKKLGGIRNWGFCPEGSIVLPKALAQVINRHGGEVWTGCRATRILTEDGVACGAIVNKDGDEIRIESSVVISNCGPKHTLELTGPETVGGKYVRELEQTIRPAVIIAIHAAVDRPLLDSDYLLVTQSRRVNTIFQPTTVCPELAPRGKHLILAGASTTSSRLISNAQEELRLCLQDLKDLLPGFDRHAEILLTGTFHREWPAMRTRPGYDMPWKTPVPGLYNVGDGVKESGMVCLPAAANSGRLVASEAEILLSSRQ